MRIIRDSLLFYSQIKRRIIHVLFGIQFRNVKKKNLKELNKNNTRIVLLCHVGLLVIIKRNFTSNLSKKVTVSLPLATESPKRSEIKADLPPRCLWPSQLSPGEIQRTETQTTRVIRETTSLRPSKARPTHPPRNYYRPPSTRVYNINRSIGHARVMWRVSSSLSMLDSSPPLMWPTYY